jgi:hypothetical protein
VDFLVGLVLINKPVKIKAMNAGGRGRTNRPPHGNSWFRQRDLCSTILHSEASLWGSLIHKIRKLVNQMGSQWLSTPSKY